MNHLDHLGLEGFRHMCAESRLCTRIDTADKGRGRNTRRPEESSKESIGRLESRAAAYMAKIMRGLGHEPRIALRQSRVSCDGSLA